MSRIDPPLEARTVASNPGRLAVDATMLGILEPGLAAKGFLASLLLGQKQRELRSFWMAKITRQLLSGDARAAVVVHDDPIVVAAYTDELDCVVLLVFDPSSIPRLVNVRMGARLLTVNNYGDEGAPAADLSPGPRATGRYTNYLPIIADFICRDGAGLAARKKAISTDEWSRCKDLGHAAIAANAFCRIGRPTRAWELGEYRFND